MGKKKTLIGFTVLFITSLRTISSDSCATFQFPTINGSSLTVDEHANLTIPFNLTYEEDCQPAENFSLRVKRITGDGNPEPQCSLRHKQGKCVPSTGPSKCVCPSGAELYRLEHAFDRNDSLSTEWEWSADGNPAEEKRIHFDVLYPAEVTSLFFYDGKKFSCFDENSSVEAVCLWENGNPPVTARLLDRHGVEMEGSINSSGQIRYTFPAVSCQDAGLIRCEAPGAKYNKTALLLVKCLQVIRENGTTTKSSGFTYLKVVVRAHTADIEKCKLTKRDSEIVCSVIAKDDTPPDLVLTIRWDNVRTQDEGEWRLELTNDAGTGHLDINLEFDGEATGENPSTSGVSRLGTTAGTNLLEQEGPKISWMALVIASTAAFVAVVAVLFAACHLCRTKSDFDSRLSLTGFSSRQLSCTGSQPGISARFAQSEECVMIHNVLYQRCRSLPGIPDSPDADVSDEGAEDLMDVDNRPPSPVIGEIEGDYAEVGQDADEPDCQESDDVYIPVSEILERKRQNQAGDGARAADTNNHVCCDGEP